MLRGMSGTPESPGETERRTVVNPVTFLRREVLTAKDLTEDTRAHVLLWLDKLTAQGNGDPRQQAVIAGIGAAYFYSLRARAELSTLPLASKEAEVCIGLFVRLSAHYAKLFRLAGLNASGKRVKKGAPTGDIFSAPREAVESEMSDEQDGMGLVASA